jgi:hypothetical protein
VVLGVPFFIKAARMAWCSTWASLLHTWNVARGFTADTRVRTPLSSSKDLSFAPAGFDVGPVLRTLAEPAAETSAPAVETQRTGYSLLTRTTAAPGLVE